MFNILLQVLDDGRLTDGQGRTVDFTNTVIVMTSNAGSQVIQKVTEEGGDQEEMREAVHESLKARFLPEFLNRIDDIVIFHPLLKTEIRRIVGLQLEELGKRLTENGLQLEVSEDAMDEVASVGYDPTFGARPLKRVIQREIQNPLAKALLTDDYPDGATVHVDYDGTRFVFSERAASKAVEI